MLIAILMVASLGLQPSYSALNTLANEQFRAGHFAGAEQAYRRALASAESQFGPDHPASAMILGNLAGTELALGRNREAGDLAVQAIERLERTVGRDSVLLVPSLNTLGGIYIDTHRYDQAEAVLKRAVHLAPHAGPHYASSLHNLAAMYYLTGRRDKAGKLNEKALRIRLALFGPDDPITQATAHNMAALGQ